MRRSILVLACTALLAPATAGAHEEGVIRISPERATIGAEIEIRGEKLGEEVRLRLELRGALETYLLGEVETAEDGKFRATPRLPEPARAGRYRIVAVAPDGDDVARADLEIVATGDRGVGFEEPREATDDPMPIETRPGPLEWLAIAAFVLACAAGGVALLRDSA